MDKVLGKKKTSWADLLPSTRKLVQLYAALLYNAHIRGFIKGEIYTGNAKAVCVPGLNCYSCPGAVGACPLGALQNALASSGHRAGFYVLGIILLYGVILGRTLCGWLCPFGLIQELLHKIPTFKIRKNAVTRALSWMKYLILAVFVIAIPLWYGIKQDLPLPAFCKYICPAGTLEGGVGLLSNPANHGWFGLLGVLFTRKLTIMLIIGLACIFCYRSFCRFLCPLGAVFGLFARCNLIGVQVDESRCNQCGACVRRCGMDVRRVADHECIHCGKCMDICRQKAISLKAGSFTLKAPSQDCPGGLPGLPEKKRKLLSGFRAAALAILCFALLWFNVLDLSFRKTSVSAQNVPGLADTLTASETASPGAEDSFQSEAPLGHEVGMQLEDFTIECFDGSSFHLKDCRGKVTIINLWATWCAPCVQELPLFSDLYQAHPDDIAMIAVHSSMQTDDPAAYVKEKGWAMPAALDTDDELVWNIVGGSTALPQTIVLNRGGEVVYNEMRSVTAQMLQELYELAGA